MKMERIKEETWISKTELGQKVQNKEIIDIDEILTKGQVILESQIVDKLLDLETELLLIGQAKGKFGGGQRRVFRQTQKKTKEGNKPKFTTLAVVGDKNGHIGIGRGKAKETVLAREKAIRKAKLNLFVIRRGSGSWESRSDEPHSIPFKVEGKCGSVTIKLMPAPKGTGLCIEKECAKILQLAGVQDIWSKTYGQTKNKINLINALESALRKLSKTKVQPKYVAKLLIVEGSYKPEQGAVTEITEEVLTVENVEEKKERGKPSRLKKESKTKPAQKKE
ncbi:MAG: 30S ribosomal protein S5 [Nanoarchaeota archaeon]|nr:30S ribosomal protein S5 [Nanoarchaeota archaeon]MBU1269147.1 30S ribosomal protein S5 [Nanoarchaeota archaeon]MBU1605109.1 30S ribosomal protein S5 [Nanoarchaeota archaeon]MBU2442790.1 30S ribosomal protein S5 [Nanoarchaeota archaeon]